MQQYLYLAQSKDGYVKYPPCKHTIHIRFKNLIWKFSIQGLKTFYHYMAYLNTPQGFKQNEYEPNQAVIQLEKHCFMASLTRGEVAELTQLLETATVELTRQELELSYLKA